MNQAPDHEDVWGSSGKAPHIITSVIEGSWCVEDRPSQLVK
jgi:hypothetical protein